MKADLHLHTTASDGRVSPAKLVELSIQSELKSIAITDHDTFDGIDEAIQASTHFDIEVIPGIELSCDIGNKDIHILVYWPDYKAKWLATEVQTLRKTRELRALKIIEKLNYNNINLTIEEVIETSGKATIGRAHIARAMHKKGYVETVQEAFDLYLGNESSCYVKKTTKKPRDLFNLINKANGVAVFAHPGVSNSDEIIPELTKLGLAGLEVYHPDHNKKQIIHYEKIAENYNLVKTGGSDFHVLNSLRGSRPGSTSIDLDVVSELKSRRPDNS